MATKDYLNDKTWKDAMIDGSTFPGAPYRYDLKVAFTSELRKEYLPIISKMPITKGPRLLATIMAHKEGFSGTNRSRRTNNPGNIGNTDSGANKKLPTLRDGIQLQIDYLNDMVAGKLKAYPIGKEMVIKPFYSKEIAANATSYKMSPWLPGYRFVFTGRLDQFVKIYSTGARGGNGYVNMIISYFKANGIDITPETTIAEILKIQ